MRFCIAIQLIRVETKNSVVLLNVIILFYSTITGVSVSNVGYYNKASRHNVYRNEFESADQQTHNVGAMQ
jgi:hypothetical protein